MNKDRLGVHVALGGGALRGVAHIGALEVIEPELTAAGIGVHAVAGTSAGALVGALWSYGYSAAQIRRIAERELSPTRLERLFPALGVARLWRLFHGEFAHLLARYVGADTTIEQFPVSFFAMATDLATGSAVTLRGNATKCILASMALPVISPPIRIDDGRLCIDGGVLMNLPISVLRRVDPRAAVIAIDVNNPGQFGTARPDEFSRRPGSWGNGLTVLRRAFQIAHQRHAVDEGKLADVLITPDTRGLSAASFRIDEFVAAGRRAAMAKIPAIRQLLRRTDSGANCLNQSEREKSHDREKNSVSV